VESENRRLTGACINLIFAVKPKLENYHEHQSAMSTIEDKRMTRISVKSFTIRPREELARTRKEVCGGELASEV
jgi:hypothetical protein